MFRSMKWSFSFLFSMAWYFSFLLSMNWYLKMLLIYMIYDKHLLLFFLWKVGIYHNCITGKTSFVDFKLVVWSTFNCWKMIIAWMKIRYTLWNWLEWSHLLHFCEIPCIIFVTLLSDKKQHSLCSIRQN